MHGILVRGWICAKFLWAITVCIRWLLSFSKDFHRFVVLFCFILNIKISHSQMKILPDIKIYEHAYFKTPKITEYLNHIFHGKHKIRITLPEARNADRSTFNGFIQKVSISSIKFVIVGLCIVCVCICVCVRLSTSPFSLNKRFVNWPSKHLLKMG